MITLSFDQSIKVILEYYKDRDFKANKLSNFKKNVKLINLHSNALPTKDKIILSWMPLKYQKLSNSNFKQLRNAIYLIRSTMNNGKVTTNKFIYESSLNTYGKLNSNFKVSLDSFLQSIKIKYTYSTNRDIKEACSRLLLDLQKKGINSPNDITYYSLKNFCSDLNFNGHSSKERSYLCNRHFAKYIKFIEQKRISSKDLDLMLDVNLTRRLFFIIDLHDEAKSQFLKYQFQTNNSLKFEKIKQNFINYIKVSNYAKNEKGEAIKLFREFSLFMIVNRLYYSMELLKIWKKYLYSIKNPNIAFRKSLNRNIFLFEQFVNNEYIDFSKINSYHKSKYIIPI